MVETQKEFPRDKNYFKIVNNFPIFPILNIPGLTKLELAEKWSQKW